MRARTRWVAAALVGALTVAACGDAFFFEPAPDAPVGVRLSYDLSPRAASLQTPVEDFENADEARIRIESETRGTLFDGVVGIADQQDGVDRVARVRVDVPEDQQVFAFVEVELLIDGSPVLRGSGSLTIVPDHPASAEITLDPVAGGTATIAGTVVNSVDNTAVAGAAVEVLPGFDATGGSPVGTDTTASDGSFSVTGLAAGDYTLVVSATGFIQARQNVTVAAGETVTRSVALSQQLGAGQTRVVLTWGQAPADLDSHMTGPDGQGGTFHVYWQNRGSATSAPFTALDVDDVDGFGPETITISEQFSGTYCYSVHNFSVDNAGGTTPLSESGALVEVFQGNSKVATFDVPSSSGTLWTVFSLGAAGITPVNQMGTASPPGVCP